MLGARFSRMEFTDEAPATLRAAFERRRPVASMASEGAFRKALYRAKWDFLSMQFTRVATAVARAHGVRLVIRQGRLKSAMVRLVGDQLEAHNTYVKRPFFQNRFRDEHGVVYTSADEPRYERPDDVPQPYVPSPVVEDSRADKRLAPPRLLDLAGLSSLLAAKDIRARAVLDTYQRMYEAGLVSYPRTEDKTITPAQFEELAPLADRIAGVAGVDPALLTRRAPRPTHVKATGMHGANRPGPTVPGSLEEVEAQYGLAGRLIYVIVAKNYLAMLAPDYQYERHKGHLERYPLFTGAANVPKDAGWKAVFDPDAGDKTGNDTGEVDEVPESVNGLGRRASPFVFEGANKRPEHPSMRWLMRQLDKHDVGTGATRTSTYSEVTSTRSPWPLLVEQGRKLTLARAGQISWLLLPGTRIGDLSLTEQVHADMKQIAAGTLTGDERLALVAGWVGEDIARMRANAPAMRDRLGLAEAVERIEGVWSAPDGSRKQIRFKRVWGGHEFTDDEVTRLLDGQTISFPATTKKGKAFTATGKLGAGEVHGRRYVGFQLEAPEGPTRWCGHVFTPSEIARLEAGEQVVCDDFVSRGGKAFSCPVSWDTDAKRITPHFPEPAATKTGSTVRRPRRRAGAGRRK